MNSDVTGTVNDAANATSLTSRLNYTAPRPNYIQQCETGDYVNLQSCVLTCLCSACLLACVLLCTYRSALVLVGVSRWNVMGPVAG